MPSTKKPASSKRAAFPREASYEKRFVKDWERLSRSGRYNMKQLKEAMMRRDNGINLEEGILEFGIIIKSL